VQGFYKDINSLAAFIKISILSVDFFREIEGFSRIAMLFKCNFHRIEAFLKLCEAFLK
jgi:hypothetical protein